MGDCGVFWGVAADFEGRDVVRFIRLDDDAQASWLRSRRF